ncbi:(3S)-malyl-CoA thioesterase [Sphingobium sp. AP50]|uniref:acyl-CoA thioesterase n=1 Tax=Sphingobium sp. AP50 TaxID=1884369 RepID=UPI0008CAB111|nr:acyl-CoA thioesterase [Sphingobium sp. AP50]SEJ95005.1 (3S)-malyl-CoA thioesterase [Sphingobium sp. AP50]
MPSDFAHLPSDVIETGRGVVFPWLCDSMGHLATQHYMGFYDSAFFHLLAALGPIHVDDGTRKVGWADVRHEVDYQAELRAGDLIALHSIVAAIGRSSVTHKTYMTRLSDQALCSTVLSRTVRFDLTARSSTPIEESIRKQAQTLFALD